MAALFDSYLMVDWSSAARPKTGADSIWFAHLENGQLSLQNPSTRHEAMQHIETILNTAKGPVLAGFDFPFGYPKGAARALAGGGWQSLWALLARHIEDQENNRNNRFEAAARLNLTQAGDGPFWGNGTKTDHAGLSRTRPAGYGRTLPLRNRYAEAEARGAQEVWKLSGVGSVGGQALTGIAALERLRQKVSVRIWPFEPCNEGHVLCEIYPSMLPPHPAEPVKDAGQVRRMAETFARLDAMGRLQELLDAPRNMPPEVRQEEACMLGLGCEPLLDAAMAESAGYIKDPSAIYTQSFTTVRAEADLSNLPEDLHPTAIRLIHACGMVDLPQDLRFSNGVFQAAHRAISMGAPILCDVEMVKAGVIARYLKGNRVMVTLNDARVPALAKRFGTTRSAAAVELWREHIEGAVVAIGNAPTALFHLLEKLEAGWPKPAAILGFPVGFVGAAESKAALASGAHGVPYLALAGRRGGSAMASAAVNALAAGLPEEAGI